MTSSRRRHDRPIESVSLKVTFGGDRKELARIREGVPSAVIRGGVCEVRFDAVRPAVMAEKARGLLERLKTVGEDSERI